MPATAMTLGERWISYVQPRGFEVPSSRPEAVWRDQLPYTEQGAVRSRGFRPAACLSWAVPSARLMSVWLAVRLRRRRLQFMRD